MSCSENYRDGSQYKYKICIEGIEKEEWACAMKEIHVDYMQGYLYGRPCEKACFKQLWDIRNIFRELQKKECQ